MAANAAIRRVFRLIYFPSTASLAFFADKVTDFTPLSRTMLATRSSTRSCRKRRIGRAPFSGS